MTRSRASLILAVSLLLIAALAVALSYALDHETPSTPPHQAGGGDVTGGTKPRPIVGNPLSKQALSKQDAAEQKRTVLGADPRAHAQGVIGRVWGAGGSPVAECEVFLMPGSQSTEVLQMMIRGEERRLPPVARGKTDKDGRFHLGVSIANPDRRYDLRVLHPRYCDFKLPNISIHPRDKYDVGDLTLRLGVTVFGRVTVQGRNLPVAEATVAVRLPHGQVDVTPPPGREGGVAVGVDGFGNYRLQNLNPDAFYSFAVRASGFATVTRDNVQLDPKQDNRLDFALPLGHRIGGVVMTSLGTPIARAKVSGYALSLKTAQTVETRTDESGRFELTGLHRGAFTIVANAEGFVEAKVQPIDTGNTDVQLTLEQQGRVELTVLGNNGRPLSDYRAVLWTHTGTEPAAHAGVSRNVRSTKGGRVEMTGINPGRYAVEVHARGHAKKFSADFLVTADARQAPKVIVQLDLGGTLVGRVLDARGKPVAGAAIKTEPQGFFENPLYDIFKVPYRISAATAETDRGGRFKIALLQPGSYQLKISHPEFCARRVNGLQVEANETSKIQDIALARGAEVSGTTRLDGKLHGQIKVIVSRMGGEDGAAPVASEAISDGKGRFRLPKRLPPGKYVAQGAEQTADFFHRILQTQKSRTEFQIVGTQKQVQIHLAVTRPIR